MRIIIHLIRFIKVDMVCQIALVMHMEEPMNCWGVNLVYLLETLDTGGGIIRIMEYILMVQHQN